MCGGGTDFNIYSLGFLFILQVWLHTKDESKDGGNKSYSLLQYDHGNTRDRWEMQKSKVVI